MKISMVLFVACIVSTQTFAAAPATLAESAGEDFGSVLRAYNRADPMQTVPFTNGLFLRGDCYYSERVGDVSSLTLAFEGRRIALVRDVSEDVRSFDQFVALYENKFTDLIRDLQSNDLMVDYGFDNYTLRESNGRLFLLYSADRMAGQLACVIGLATRF
jgi:hypothetical protein